MIHKVFFYIKVGLKTINLILIETKMLENITRVSEIIFKQVHKWNWAMNILLQKQNFEKQQQQQNNTKNFNSNKQQ